MTIHGGYSAYIEDQPVVRKKIWDHAMNGTLIAFGDIEKASKNKVTTIYDITPTILAYSNIPIPHNTDGKIIEDITRNQIGKYNYYRKWYILRRIRRKKSRKNKNY